MRFLEVTGARLGTSNAELRRELRNELLKKLSQVTEKLLQNLVETESAGDQLASTDLAEYWASLKVSTYQLAENRASATLDIPLRGKGSLLAHLPLAYNTETLNEKSKGDSTLYDQRPGIAEYDSSDLEPLLYTGLIIDARPPAVRTHSRRRYLYEFRPPDLRRGIPDAHKLLFGAASRVLSATKLLPMHAAGQVRGH
jgi:hypothetical protein